MARARCIPKSLVALALAAACGPASHPAEPAASPPACSGASCCLSPGAACDGATPCCAEVPCVDGRCGDVNGGLCTTAAQCQNGGCAGGLCCSAGACTADSDCCAGDCAAGFCTAPPPSGQCAPLGGSCGTDAFCCAGDCVGSATGFDPVEMSGVCCVGSGVGCQADSDCCAAAGLACVAGHCAPPQAPGGECDHAGACSTGICEAGQCACPPSQPQLCATGGDPYCSDTGKDPLNCGGCGAACAAGETCSGGRCRWP